MTITNKQAITAVILVSIVGFALGLFVGVKYLAPSLTQHHYTNTIEKPTIVQGTVTTDTKTQIAYVPKETVVTKYIDSTGKEVTSTSLEKTDLDANIGKATFNVKLNGKELVFNKADNESYILEKNKVALDQSTVVTFDATVSPTVIDDTKRWSVGVGCGTNGISGKVDFPIGKSNNVGGFVYGDKKTQSVGVNFRF